MSDQDIEEFMDVVGTGHIDNKTEVVIFDFLGYLTTREEGIRVGADYNPTPLLECYKQWRKRRGKTDY